MGFWNRLKSKKNKPLSDYYIDNNGLLCVDKNEQTVFLISFFNETNSFVGTTSASDAINVIKSKSFKIEI